MAENEDLDLDVKPESGKKKMVLVIAGAALLLAIVAVGLTFWLVSGDESAGEGSEVVAVPKAQYMEMDNLVVNFAQRGPARFLQIQMQLMAHDPSVFQVVEQHMPVIRNNLGLLLADAKYEEVSTREGREALNQMILETINEVVQARSDKEGIQAVYFTNFVMQ